MHVQCCAFGFDMTPVTGCIHGCGFKNKPCKKESSQRGQGLWLPQAIQTHCLGLGTGLIVSSPLSPLSSQEEDFIRPSSREEAQQLWEAERLKMRQILDRQQKQMVEDYQWLRQEEKSLVSSH